MYTGGGLAIKKVRNRTPDSVKYFFSKFVLPYSSILAVAVFVLTCQLVRAAEVRSTFIANDQVMDLDPVEVANVVTGISSLTPNYQEDSIQVILAMKDQEFIDKPVIAKTITTKQPEPEVSKDRKSTVNYTVEGNDTLSKIGWKYGLKIATIKITNDLSSDTIKPGQVLKLPPADLSASYISQMTQKSKKVSGARTVNRSPGSQNNAYPYGWCTYYVATRRYVPAHWGNAKSWLDSARRSGYATGQDPAVGAIMVSSESWYGHVAYVESVSGSRITIAEMNYVGWGVSSRRTISAYGGAVRGYIY